MGILRGNRHSGSAAIELTEREVEETPLGRCEAQAFAPGRRVVDPYAEWVARREQQQTRERPEVRWVVGAGAGNRAGASATSAPRGESGRQASGSLAGVV